MCLLVLSCLINCTVKFVFVHVNIKVNKLERPDIKFLPSYFNVVYYNKRIKNVQIEDASLVHGCLPLKLQVFAAM